MRKFRFGLARSRADSAAEWREYARAAEDRRRMPADAIETVEDQSAGIAEIQSTIFFGRKSISGGADENPA